LKIDVGLPRVPLRKNAFAAFPASRAPDGYLDGLALSSNQTPTWRIIDYLLPDGTIYEGCP